MKNREYRPTGINNFHNSPAITVRLGEIKETHEGPLYPITENQSRRIKRHFCGITDCRCPAGGVVEYEEGRHGLDPKWVE